MKQKWPQLKKHHLSDLLVLAGIIEADTLATERFFMLSLAELNLLSHQEGGLAFLGFPKEATATLERVVQARFQTLSESEDAAHYDLRLQIDETRVEAQFLNADALHILAEAVSWGIHHLSFRAARKGTVGDALLSALFASNHSSRQ